MGIKFPLKLAALSLEVLRLGPELAAFRSNPRSGTPQPPPYPPPPAPAPRPPALPPPTPGSATTTPKRPYCKFCKMFCDHVLDTCPKIAAHKAAGTRKGTKTTKGLSSLRLGGLHLLRFESSLQVLTSWLMTIWSTLYQVSPFRVCRIKKKKKGGQETRLRDESPLASASLDGSVGCPSGTVFD